MISRDRRLRAAEVREVLANSSRARAGALSVRYQATPEPLRAAVVAPKARFKSAVMRNRLRRAVYRALAEVQVARGRAVFFIDAVPTPPLSPAYHRDIKALLKI
jgi:ribonuclease P protein component